jgi:hypothetical protein
MCDLKNRPSCPACRSWMKFESCDECGATGWVFTGYDDDTICCPKCGGVTGWWICVSCGEMRESVDGDSERFYYG